MDKPPFQKLSERTQSSDKSPLDPDTVSKIWRRERAVYRSSLERLFRAVGLKLNPNDHISFCEDLKIGIHNADTRVFAKPQQEEREAIETSATTQNSKRRINYDSWGDVIPQMTRIEHCWLPKDIQAMRAAATMMRENSWLPKDIQAMRAAATMMRENSWLGR